MWCLGSVTNQKIIIARKTMLFNRFSCFSMDLFNGTPSKRFTHAHILHRCVKTFSILLTLCIINHKSFYRAEFQAFFAITFQVNIQIQWEIHHTCSVSSAIRVVFFFSRIFFLLCRFSSSGGCVPLKWSIGWKCVRFYTRVFFFFFLFWYSIEFVHGDHLWYPDVCMPEKDRHNRKNSERTQTKMRSRYKRNLKRYPKMKNGILVYMLSVCGTHTPYVVVVGFCCYCYCYSCCCYCCWSILSSISSSLDVDIFVHMNRQKSFSVLFAIT